MKRYIFIFAIFIFSFFCFAEAGETTIPDAKRPRKVDSEKLLKAEEESEKGSLEKNREILKFGMDSEITDLIDEIVKNEDVRFVDEIYDLFQVTKSNVIREKIIDYFTKLEDPCIEDYAVEILDDPYDQKNSTVNACFLYVQKCKTKEALPAILRLIESEEEKYFNNALTTLGEIGGPDEAVYLTEYLERTDLPLPQRQSLVKVLGKIKAVETFDALVEMAENTDENSFVRMYASEAIGAMEKEEALPVLLRVFEDSDPRIRQYALKGISHFETDDAKNTILQATRDNHVLVRNEALDIVKEKNIPEAVPYLIFRAKNDPEVSVKNSCYSTIAKLNTNEGNEFLTGLLSDKKTGATAKSKIVAALLENWDKNSKAGKDEIISLAKTVTTDDRRKPLRYAMGKEFAKYGDEAFEEICSMFLDSKDVSTVGTGLDIFAKGRYESVRPKVENLAREHQKYLDYEENKATLDPKTRPVRKNANAEKATKILNSGSDKNRPLEKEKNPPKEKPAEPPKPREKEINASNAK